MLTVVSDTSVSRDVYHGGSKGNEGGEVDCRNGYPILRQIQGFGPSAYEPILIAYVK